MLNLKMASIALRSGIPRFSRYGSRNLRLYSSEADSSNSSAKAPGDSAGQSIISGNTPRNQPPPPKSDVETVKELGKEWKRLKFLGYGLICALTGVATVAGYATYAYTLDEVNEKTKAFRESAKQIPPIDSSGIEKYQNMLYSTAVAVPAKAVDLYLELRKFVEEQVKEYTEPLLDKLLPDLEPSEQHVFTLVLDLNETLVYTDWNRDRGFSTFKRPGVDAFLKHLADFYEIIVYSDEVEMYVIPVCDRLDPNQHYLCARLSKPDTKYQNGKYYRDLSKLNRDLKKILYVSGHALESSLQPENCVPIKPYKLEADDTALVDLIPFLEYVARNSPPDIRSVLASYDRENIAKEFLERSQEHHKQMQERGRGRFWKRFVDKERP